MTSKLPAWHTLCTPLFETYLRDTPLEETCNFFFFFLLSRRYRSGIQFLEQYYAATNWLDWLHLSKMIVLGHPIAFGTHGQKYSSKSKVFETISEHLICWLQSAVLFAQVSNSRGGLEKALCASKSTYPGHLWKRGSVVVLAGVTETFPNI